MAFPDDLSNVAVFKIHPAIGIARVANNEDYYEFFEQMGLAPGQRKYMSAVNGVPTMRRQAVQFKIFAYSKRLDELGELTPEDIERLGLAAEWTASIGNRKLLNYGKRKSPPLPLPAVTAKGSATGNNTTQLQGDNPWDATLKVTLGYITGKGLFIPGFGGVTRKEPGSRITPYPANQSGSLDCLDTSADGSITVKISGTDIPVVPACVVCAPQDHSPDVNAAALAFGGVVTSILPAQVRGSNSDWASEIKPMLGITGNPPVGRGTRMDAAMNATTNGSFSPGMETSFDFSRTEFTRPNINKIFFERDKNFIDANEIRPQYKALESEPQGALPGQLTSGLCSTWQGDLSACLGFWTAEFPQRAYVNNVSMYLMRKNCNSTTPMSNSPEDLNLYADQAGVARNVSTDPSKIEYVETERNC